jgi:hypothetical protein
MIEDEKIARAPGDVVIRARVIACDADLRVADEGCFGSTGQQYATLTSLTVPLSSRAPILGVMEREKCARHFSPRIEETSSDTVLFDVRGLRALIGDAQQIARAIENRAGLPVDIAVAADPDAAILAARGIRGTTVIAPGGEAAVLSRLPLNLLPGSSETADLLNAWGIRTLGELATLPPLGVAARLGPEGTYLQHLAQWRAGRQRELLWDNDRGRDGREPRQHPQRHADHAFQLRQQQQPKPRRSPGGRAGPSQRRELLRTNGEWRQRRRVRYCRLWDALQNHPKWDVDCGLQPPGNPIPDAGLIQGTNGDFYGATGFGGLDCGTIYSLSLGLGRL